MKKNVILNILITINASLFAANPNPHNQFFQGNRARSAQPRGNFLPILSPPAQPAAANAQPQQEMTPKEQVEARRFFELITRQHRDYDVKNLKKKIYKYLQEWQWQNAGSIENDAPVSALALSLDKTLIITGDTQNHIKIWQNNYNQAQNTWQITLAATLAGHTGRVTSVALSTDKRILISGSHDNTVKVWLSDAQGNWQPQAYATLEGHTAPVNSVALSLQQNLIASGSSDNTIKIWHTQAAGNWALSTTLEGHTAPVNSVALSSENNLIVSGSDDTTVKVWRAQYQGWMPQPIASYALFNAVKAVALSQDQEMIVSGDKINNVSVRIIENGNWQNPLIENLTTSALIPNPVRQGVRRRLFIPASINSLSLSNYNKTLVSATEGGIDIWNRSANQWAKTTTLLKDKNIISAILSSDSRIIVSAFDRQVTVWMRHDVSDVNEYAKIENRLIRQRAQQQDNAQSAAAAAAAPASSDMEE